MSISTEKLFGQDAVSSCPDGWTCVQCGDEYSENTVDVKDYYVINTDEGTLCSPCHALDNATLECRECGSLLIGYEPRIITTCDECKQEEKDTKEMFENFTTEQRLDEVIQWITSDVWDELSTKSKHRIIKQLGYMGYPTDDLNKTIGR